MTFTIGNARVGAPMAELARSRAQARLREGIAFDYPMSSIIAAIYMQGFIDAVDVMQKRKEPTDADR